MFRWGGDATNGTGFDPGIALNWRRPVAPRPLELRDRPYADQEDEGLRATVQVPGEVSDDSDWPF